MEIIELKNVIGKINLMDVPNSSGDKRTESVNLRKDQ